jgi:GNAT superfamily N-acetyltransferase
MNLTIKPLTPELAPAYLDFFDNRAFSDNNPMGPCYCNAAIMSSEELDKMVGEFGDDCKGTLRRYAAEQLAAGRIFGYLAFDGDAPVGWCNAGNMGRYPVSRHQAIPDFARANACAANTVSVVCFAIAPEYRKRGVASALLERVITDAASQGCFAVEGYVNTKYAGAYWDFTGPSRLYEKFGFIETTRQGERVVMRKILNEGARC